MIKIYDKEWTEDQFIKFVKESQAKGDLARKLGFTYYSGFLWQKIFAEIRVLNLSTDHFDSRFWRKKQRGLSIEISKELLEEKIKEGLTLKQLSVYFTSSQSNIRYWIKKFGLKLVRGSKGKLPKDFVKERKCACGETDPNKFYGNKTTICAVCHNKQNLERGKDKRLFAINLLGGKCCICGFDQYMAALDIHHLDPSAKDSSFASMRGWSEERIIKELEKCVLLCGNCHAAHHSGELISNKLL